MRNMRAALSMAVIAIAALAAAIQTVEAEDATSECLSRPNKAAPDGSHWWYRIDRSTHRRCWYLGPERTAARRSSRTRRERPPADPSPSETALPAPDHAPAGTPAITGGENSRAATATDDRGIATPAEAGAITATTFSAGWPRVANSTASNDPGPTRVDAGDEAEAAVPTEPPADMPLVWPELADADRAALADADRAVVVESSDAAPGVGHLLLFVATLAAFFAVALHAIVKLRKSWVGHRHRPMLSRTSHRPVQPMPEPAIGTLHEADVFARWKTAVREHRVRRHPRWEQDRAANPSTAKRPVAA